MTTDQIVKPNFQLSESPASWNTRYVTPNGFVCQITLRADSGKDLLERADVAMSFLFDHGYVPDNHSSNNHNGGETKVCPIHKSNMRRYSKDGRSWFSHRIEDGSWCKGKQPGNGGQHV
jgi:hypothetical protein